MADPLVSVVVLSFNRRACTLECLASVRSQTYRPLEVVVLDNGSSDGSAEAIESEFPEVRLIRMPRNYGDWEGRDIAAANCRGEYLFLLDNDAVAQPDTIATLVTRMEHEPELAVAQARVVDPVTGHLEGAEVGGRPIESDHYRASFLGGASLIRARALRLVGGFPHYLLGGGEPFLSYRFLDLGYRIVVCGQALVLHKKSPEQRAPHQRYFLSSLQRLRALMSHYPGLARPLLELCWKSVAYAAGALRRGFIWQLAPDMVLLVYGGLRAWRGPWRIKPDTVRLVDYLRSNVVSTPEEYIAIPLGHSHFLRFARRRLSGTCRTVRGDQAR